MDEILIAEDSATQATQIRILLESAGYAGRIVPDGVAAMESLAQHAPVAVLTDLDMPRMNGLDLVVAVRREHPQLPVILMTAFGSEEIAVQALQAGAASYVPKKNLAGSLVNTLQDVLEVARSRREDARLDAFVEGVEAKFELSNVAAQGMAVIGYVQQAMTSLGLGDEADQLRLGVALDAAIQNAMYLGNLELDARQLKDAARSPDGGKSLGRLVNERSRQPSYCDRKVRVEVRLSRSAVECVVGHNGPGFDVQAALAADDALKLAADRDCDWILVKSLTGKVAFNGDGNEVTLSQRYSDESRAIAATSA